MKYSVIIPTLNEVDNLPRLIKQLTLTKDIEEIIVVDGGSSDGTTQLSLPRVARLIKSHPPVGFQRQQGASAAVQEIMIFLDADVTVNPKLFDQIKRRFADPQITIACPYYSPKPGNWPIRIVYAFFNLMFFLFQRIAPSGAGSCIVVRADAWRDSTGFDHTNVFDDIEFIRRLARAGRFTMLNVTVGVSDRRFRKQGIIKTTIEYLGLSLFFLLGWFGPIRRYPYKFNHYGKKSQTH